MVLWIAAIFCTLFPIMYSFSRWRQFLLGRILMLTMVSLALAVDLTLLFAYWQPKDILVSFWIEVIVFSLIAISTAGMSYKMWQLNRKK
jgi:hypothetical protein